MQLCILLANHKITHNSIYEIWNMKYNLIELNVY